MFVQVFRVGGDSNTMVEFHRKEKNVKRFISICILALVATWMVGCGHGSETTQKYETTSFSGLEQLTTSKSGEDFGVNVAPDGSRIVFCSTRSGNAHLYVKDIGSMAVSQKTFGSTENCDPAFSPDGKFIAFSSNRSGNFDIFVISADEGGAVRQLTFASENEYKPSWSADGKKIVYTRWSYVESKWMIWITHVDTGQVINLGEGYDPEWSPIANEVAFIRKSNESDNYQSLWKIDEKGNRQLEILHADDWGVWSPTWSPDGQHILFATVNKSLDHKTDVAYQYIADDLWIVKANGSQLTQLTTNKEADWSPSWGKVNGEDRIFFSSQRSKYSCLWACTPRLLEF